MAIRDNLRDTAAVATMQLLRDSLQNQINAPQEPTYQQQVSAALQQLSDALAEAASNAFSPAWREVLDELGVAGLLGEPLADAVQEIFERNQITPSVALEEVQALTSQLEELTVAIDHTLEGLSHLRIGSEDLTPGQAEVGVLIPRPAVESELEKLGREFVELQKVLSPFLEVVTGSRPPLHVSTISSSDFGVFLDVAPQVAAFIAVAVERVVALYKNLLEIRVLRQGLRDQGLADESLAGVDDHAHRHMSEGINGAVEELLEQHQEIDQGRRNELKTELRWSLNAIANRIDRGYNIEVRAALPPTSDEGEDEGDDEAGTHAAEGESGELWNAVRLIADVSPKLRFINRSGEPILGLPEAPSADETSAGSGEPS